jgi:hypothetical protein
MGNLTADCELASQKNSCAMELEFKNVTVHLGILCNDNQPDALFILNLFRQSTSTCLGYVYCPSSAGIPCICTVIGTCYTFKLTGSLPG